MLGFFKVLVIKIFPITAVVFGIVYGLTFKGIGDVTCIGTEVECQKVSEALALLETCSESQELTELKVPFFFTIRFAEISSPEYAHMVTRPWGITVDPLKTANDGMESWTAMFAHELFHVEQVDIEAASVEGEAHAYHFQQIIRSCLGLNTTQYYYEMDPHNMDDTELLAFSARVGFPCWLPLRPVQISLDRCP